MLSDVEEGNNLMLTRLTPVATLIDTEQQQPLALTRKLQRFRDICAIGVMHE